MTTRFDLLDGDEGMLKAWLVELGAKGFRAKQIRDWLYTKGAMSVDAMTNLPLSLRESLSGQTTIGTLDVVTEQKSKDGTRKRLYRLHDGKMVEAVLMPYADGRRTACISSQAGCAMGCVFCATGQMGFGRHLTATEILEQAWRYDAELKQQGGRLSNVVLMGMGEPFHNYDAVIVAIRRMMSDLGIGARHITVSTVGLVPKIRALAEEGLQVTLAVSLHAANDSDRSALLPVGRKWPLEELVDACWSYVRATRRRITFEWALIAGETDRPEQAHELGKLLKGMLCHVNVIPLNPTGGYGGVPTRREDADRFIEILGRYSVPGTVRVRRGIDIDAGCGQLTTAYEQGELAPGT